MSIRFPLVVAWFVLLSVVVGNPSSGAAFSKTLTGQQVVEAQNKLAFALFKKLEVGKGNVVFSPYSVSTVMEMVFIAARQKTAQEMSKVLGLPHNDLSTTALTAWQRRQMVQGAKAAGNQFFVSNRLWGQRGYPFSPRYLQTLKTHWDIGLGSMDFKNNAKRARQEINNWVAKQTKQKILNLLPKGALKPSTRLVLTNALYFKAKWNRVFKKKNTRDRDFWLSKTQKKQVKTMERTAYYAYRATSDLQVVKIPYKGRAFSMLILLPKSKEGWKALNSSLTAKKWAQWTGKMKQWKRLNLRLPRFRFSSSSRLKQAFQALGLKQAFTNQANFSGMLKKSARKRNRLKIDAILHKAFVEVDESGTKAAAATAVLMVKATSAIRVQKPIPFHANRPFLFAIQSNKTGSILFLGRVRRP